MRHKSVSYARYGYFFVLPFVIIFLIFSLYPIIYTIFLSFTDLNMMTATDINIKTNSNGGIDPFGNFASLFSNLSFRTSISNTAIIWILNFTPQIILALLFAAWFTSKRIEIAGQGAFKVLFYMPNIITAGTIAILFRTLFAFPNGVVNDILYMLGFIAPVIDPVTGMQTNPGINFFLYKEPTRGIIAFIQFWMWYGYTMLILISGILGLNPELFEAAEIDGASSTQSFFQITLPNLRTILIYTLVTSLIGGLQMFDIPLLFNNGGPLVGYNTTQTASMFIYNTVFGARQRLALGAAASLILFVIIAIFAAIIFHMMRDKQEVREKKIIEAKRRAYR
jgi:multiple sugar transport system permease protein